MLKVLTLIAAFVHCVIAGDVLYDALVIGGGPAGMAPYRHG